MSPKTGIFYEFLGYRLDPGPRLLTHGDKAIQLTPKAFDLLMLLVERAPNVVSRQEILESIWPETFVEEGNINYTISSLRKALDNRELISTVPKIGYRFGVPISVVERDQHKPTPDPPRNFEPPKRRQRVASLLLVVAAISLVLFTGYLPRESVVHNAPDGHVKSVAVLPFVALPGTNIDPSELELASSAISQRLGLVRGLTVRPTDEVGKQTDPLAAGLKLGVEKAVTGTYSDSANGPVLQIGLFDVVSGREIWGDTIEAPELASTELHGDIAGRIAISLFAQLKESDILRVKQIYTKNPEAYRQYAVGRAIFNHSSAGSFEHILEAYNRAVALDPAFALAYAGLADLYFRRASQSEHSESSEFFRRAESFARKAFNLDPELSQAHTALGRAHRAIRKDLEAAEASFARAIELDPNNVQAYGFLGQILILRGDIASALKIADRVETIDPNARQILFLRYRGYEAILDTKNGLEFFQRAFEVDPHVHYARIGYVRFLYYAGEYEKMAAVANGGFEHSRGFSFVWKQMLARAALRRGDITEFRQQLTALQSGAQQSTRYLYHLAVVHAERGEHEKAFELLARCADQNEEWMMWMNSEPAFEGMREDPRFRSMLSRITGLS